MVRLNKHLADLGIASRRKADELIARGLVLVNGKVVTALGTQIDPEQDKATVKDQVIQEQKELIYILLHKPVGYVTSAVRTKVEPKIVLDLVMREGELPRVFPVGRLDKDTSGLLILTNDGVLAYRLTHPSFECEKEYEVSIDGVLTAERVRKLEAGVRLWGEKTKSTKLEVLSPRVARIVLREGKNRQVRRIFQKVGCPVKTLKRVRVKDFLLDESLRAGQWRYLQKEEVRKLLSLEMSA